MSLSRLITDLYKTIAIEESDIERLRQVFSHMREFTTNQRALFDIFDTTKDGKLTASEILRFLQDNLVQGATVGDCAEIISEFDSNQDGTLTYDEFLNMFLPASDYNLRNNEFFPDPRMGPIGLPTSVPAMAARILERERTFISRRRECRFNLASFSATDINRIFDDISRGRQDIVMPDLIWFLDTNGFQP